LPRALGFGGGTSERNLRSDYIAPRQGQRFADAGSRCPLQSEQAAVTSRRRIQQRGQFIGAQSCCFAIALHLHLLGSAWISLRRGLAVLSKEQAASGGAASAIRSQLGHALKRY
jgi:hypothetical protein